MREFRGAKFLIEKTCSSEQRNFRLLFQNDPDGADDSWNVAKDSQKNVEPEMKSNSNLEENSERWKYDCGDDANYVHVYLLILLLERSLSILRYHHSLCEHRW